MFCQMFSAVSVILLSGSILTAALPIGPKTTLPSAWGYMLVKHKWDVTPDNWVTLGYPPNGTTIDFHISLKPNRENALIDVLHEVSQPGHPKYGAHLTKEQVADLVAPHPDTLELVSTWLEYKGVPPSSISTSHGGGWLTVTGVPVPQANELLGASYQLYYHARTNDTILRTAGYALPAVLHTHVRTVVPSTAFTSSRFLQQPPRSRPGGAAEAGNVTMGEPANMLSRRDTSITPSVLRSMYKTEAYIPTGREDNAIGIVGLENQYPSRTDLWDFMDKYRTGAELPSLDFQTVNYNLGYIMVPGQEANLGVQYTSALASQTPLIYYMSIAKGIGRIGAGDRYTEWLDYMAAKTSVPPTISMAYGITSELSITLEYAEAVCKLFGQLGARGVSIFVASGDDGVGEGQCPAYDFKHLRFYTTFPASCPWVTGVGGTIGGTTSDAPEVANSYSGGGFSTFFSYKQPHGDRSFQVNDVNAFLKNLGDKYSGKYQPLGRGVPDIALQSSYYELLLNRRDYSLDGTSPATHTAAAIFSQLNDYRMTKNMAPLGWLNPWLYGLGYIGMNDITSGNNQGCGTEGFESAKGWDPVTGLGSPNFPLLQTVVDIENQNFGNAEPPPA